MQAEYWTSWTTEMTDILDAIKAAQAQANLEQKPYAVTKRLRVMRYAIAVSQGYQIVEVCRPCQ